MAKSELANFLEDNKLRIFYTESASDNAYDCYCRIDTTGETDAQKREEAQEYLGRALIAHLATLGVSACVSSYLEKPAVIISEGLEVLKELGVITQLPTRHYIEMLTYRAFDKTETGLGAFIPALCESAQG